MTSDDIEKIYSNEYADFFIEYYGIPSVLEEFKEYGIQIINFFQAVAYLPVGIMTADVLSKLTYTVPALFGLTNVNTIESSGITRLRNIPNFNLRGKGVLIGFVDTGIDYTNPIFQKADRTTRISAIWDQTIRRDPPQEGVIYGTEYSREQINEALRSQEPYQIVPSRDEIGHGTMMAGIAAGNEVPEKGFYGVAPEADIIAVKLKPAKPYIREYFQVPQDAVCFQENDLLFGIQYLLNYAFRVNQPIVICMSCDTSQYARDGKDFISSWLSLQASYPGLSVFIPAGNEGSARRHFYGSIDKGKGYETVELNVGPKEKGFTMELWGASPNVFTIDIISPSGEYISKIDARLKETFTITFIFEATIIYIHYRIIDAQNGDQLIRFRFIDPSEGIWKINVYGRGIYPMDFHIWLPMNDFITADTYFLRSNPYTTLLSLSCATVPVTVTAYNTEDDSLYSNAGRGYTRINMIKPDIAAPGVNILSPSLDQGFVLVSGTSAATAHAAGVAAMLLEWGIIKGNYPLMSTQDIKIFMIRGARRNIDISYPNKDWGYGILDAYSVFDRIR